MAFGTGKDTGLNNSTKRQMKKLVDSGYKPQEISDQIQVRLSCILSFYQDMTGKTDEEMKEFSSVDASEDVLTDAQRQATDIVEKAKEEAARIRADALEDLEEAAEALDD